VGARASTRSLHSPVRACFRVTCRPVAAPGGPESRVWHRWHCCWQRWLLPRAMHVMRFFPLPPILLSVRNFSLFWSCLFARPLLLLILSQSSK
jgi:hypothetical protein